MPPCARCEPAVAQRGSRAISALGTHPTGASVAGPACRHAGGGAHVVLVQREADAREVCAGARCTHGDGAGGHVGAAEIEIPAQKSGTSIHATCSMGMYNLELNFM